MELPKVCTIAPTMQMVHAPYKLCQMGVCSKQLAPWHIGLLPSMMVMNGDGDDDTKASIFGKAVSHSCHVCLVSSLTVSFLSSPHVDPHEPLHERGPRCMSTTNYARARMQPVLPTVLCSATNMAFLQPCEKSTRSQSMRAHVKRQV